MPPQIDVKRLRKRALSNIREVVHVYDEAVQKKMKYLGRRWIAAMVVVDTYAIWERYAERRVAAGLNHHPQQFLKITESGISSACPLASPP